MTRNWRSKVNGTKSRNRSGHGIDLAPSYSFIRKRTIQNFPTWSHVVVKEYPLTDLSKYLGKNCYKFHHAVFLVENMDLWSFFSPDQHLCWFLWHLWWDSHKSNNEGFGDSQLLIDQNDHHRQKKCYEKNFGILHFYLIFRCRIHIRTLGKIWR